MDHRLRWLDATRGMSVLMVLVAHTLDQFSDRYKDFIELGNAGVVMFFLCSGYVIALSLDHQSFAQFWVRRFFRLYPLYWCSILLFLALGLSQDLTEGQIFANITMLQEYLGAPHVSVIYWSLMTEISFYALMSVLKLARLHKHSGVIFLTLAGSGLILTMLFPIQSSIPTSLPICAAGMIFYRYDQGRYTRGLLRFYLLALIAYLLLLGAPLTFTVGWLVAVVCFVTLYEHREQPWPGWLVWCGMVSYSIYLLHPFPLHFFHGWGWVFVFPLAALGHTLIEAPAIRLGRRLAPSTTPTLVTHP